jgi:hypothetical protein
MSRRKNFFCFTKPRQYLLNVVRSLRDERDGYGEPLNYLAALLQISRLRLAVDRSR